MLDDADGRRRARPVTERDGETIAAEQERELAELLERPTATREDVLQVLRRMPQRVPCALRDRWKRLAASASLEPWRRLEAYRVLVSSCLAYPCPLADFVREALAPVCNSEADIVDMTIAQHLPMPRDGDAIRMVTLPISTPIGPAALYFAVRQPGGLVVRAAVHPEPTEDWE